MAKLTSWKEIAQYLGKGVRTVQRWEAMLGLPVRRPLGKTKGIVLADTEEIDVWVSTCTPLAARDAGGEVDRLERVVSELLSQNCQLRAEIERLRGAKISTLEPQSAMESVAAGYDVAAGTDAGTQLEWKDLPKTRNTADGAYREKQPPGSRSSVA